LVQNLSLIPSIHFDAYHPDLCYAVCKEYINEPLDANHSIIVLAAYSCGFDVDKTAKLFNKTIYEKCGYLDRWCIEKDNLLRLFNNYSLDLSAPVLRWGRGDAFMYSVTHPKVRCIFDIAKSFMNSIGVDTLDGGLLPVDNLVNGACFPVYLK
jgi:hypothetical protein